MLAGSGAAVKGQSMPRALVDSGGAQSARAGLALRPATRDDLTALLMLETAEFSGDRLSRRSLRRLLAAASATTIVAVAEGRIVGYALVLVRKGARVARLYSLARDSAFAGRGIGTALLAAAEAAAVGRGAAELRLEVRSDNTPGRALYRRHGYVETGTSPDYYEDHTDAIRMRKPLSDASR
jgi:ribosomal-protein-alanine N-acetyltransferase